ncbi:MAG: 4a-hydroxytetrahydrobiopterin dehydratase [Chthonomonas sp.]|nr:4a-hydroxytetrahydrobiopterin dehydratase [Chthonomonas sp.]
MLSYEKLSTEQIAAESQTVPQWRVDGVLIREYQFPSYKDGLVFAVAVGHLADTLNHHPDIFIGYQKVTVSMVTHDAGGGLTAYDFELARRIDRLGT